MPKKERWHYDKRIGLVYNVDENGERIGPPQAPSYICRGIEPDKGALIAAAPALLEALKLAEWGGTVALSVESKCPVCGGLMTMSHRPDCKLAAALAKAEGRAG